MPKIVHKIVHKTMHNRAHLSHRISRWCKQRWGENNSLTINPASIIEVNMNFMNFMNFMNYSQIIRKLSWIITTFVAIQPALGMGGSRHIGFRALRVHRSPQTLRLHRASPRSGKRTFSERYLLFVRLRNFDSIRRYRNEASMLSVL